MPATAQMASAASQSIGGLFNMGIGLAQRAEGKKMLKRLGEAPTEYIPNEVLQNQNMAQLRANTGLPSEQYNQAMKNLQRNQLIALRGGQDRKAGLSLVGSGQQMMDDATLRLDTANANARMQNEKTLYGINNQVGGWKDKVWQNNVNNPYMRKYQYAQSLVGAGNQNATTGVNQLFGAGASYAGSGGFNSGNAGQQSGRLTGYSGMRDALPYYGG